MTYENEDFGQRLIDAESYNNETYYDNSELTQDGFSIINPISETFAAQIAEEITEEWQAEIGTTRAVDRANGTVIIKTPFDAASHALSKDIGGCVKIGMDAERRARQMRNCPLLAQARKNSEEAEARLKAARGKEFPEEAKPEDQYRHLDVSVDDVRDAVNEFLAGCEVSSKGKEFMTAETLFGRGNASAEVLEIRTAVRACIYAYITQAKKKTAQIFGAVELHTFSDSFLDWYYNYQHYSQGAVHTHFSDLLQIILEKTLTGDE